MYRWRRVRQEVDSLSGIGRVRACLVEVWFDLMFAFGPIKGSVPLEV
jgi:hypothetical protein